MSTFDIGSLSGSQNYSGFVDGTEEFELYKFSLSKTGTFTLALDGMSNNADVQLLNNSGDVLHSSIAGGTSPEAINIDALAAGNYAVKILPVSGTTDYKLNLKVDENGNTGSKNSNIDSMTGMEIVSGYFTVGDTGQVSIDFLFDGGWYKGEVGAFSLEGMDKFVPGSEAFIQEAGKRSLSNSPQGYVVISDATEDAKFSGGLGEGNYNDSQYLGVKTFAMKPGDQFGFMLIPNGKVQDAFNNPTINGDKRPLFSLVTANPKQGFHIGQIADINGEGNTFSIEDQRIDSGSDKDYNDLIFKISGATGKGIKLDEVINPAKEGLSGSRWKK